MAEVEPMEVVDNQPASRFEAIVGGQLAGFIDYDILGDRVAMLHTETLDGFGGRGVATRLIASALADVSQRAMRVVPICPFVRRYIEEHPEDGDLVAKRRPSNSEN